MISIAIDNGRHNTVGGGCHSVHQAESKFAEHNIDNISWVSRKCKTRAGVSEDVYKTLECVTKTDSKFSNRVLLWTMPKSTSINGVTIWLEQLDFCLNRCKRELPDQHIPNSISPHELFFLIPYNLDSLQSWYVLVNETPGLDKAKFLISELDSCWVPTLWLLWSDQHTYCFRCVLYNGMRSSICVINDQWSTTCSDATEIA